MKKKCSGLVSLQLDQLILDPMSSRTRRPKIVNESLHDDSLPCRYTCKYNIPLIVSFNTMMLPDVIKYAQLSCFISF